MTGAVLLLPNTLTHSLSPTGWHHTSHTCRCQWPRGLREGVAGSGSRSQGQEGGECSDSSCEAKPLMWLSEENGLVCSLPGFSRIYRKSSRYCRAFVIYPPASMALSSLQWVPSRRVGMSGGHTETLGLYRTQSPQCIRVCCVGTVRCCGLGGPGSDRQT
jgi:hypothetical protein